MIVVREPAASQRKRLADAVPVGIAGPMHRCMYGSRLAADIFHDVDLAARRPTAGLVIVSQHPERRPDTLAVRDPDARFHQPVSKRKRALGLQPRRSEL